MDGLPTTTSFSKSDRRRKPKPHPASSKPSLFLAFLSCLAWLYVAGRLWQDAENRALLSSLLRKNYDKRPKVLTVEDKLTVLGCKDLERRIVETEMELTLAKSQGYLMNRLSHGQSSKDQKLLAVIGVYTGFGSRLKRNVFRGSWMPKGDALKKLEERGVVIRFVIGRSANRGDSLDRNINGENLLTKDFLILENHEEAEEEMPKKAKFFFSAAVQNWDAEFYVKVNDNIDLDLEGLIELLDRRRGQDGAYIGCMKAGDVITEEGKQWFEPDWWKFGDEKSYFRHAASSLIILSRNLAQYININSASLKTYAHDDISVGSWMMGLQATYIDDNRLCCGNKQDKLAVSVVTGTWDKNVTIFHCYGVRPGLSTILYKYGVGLRTMNERRFHMAIVEELNLDKIRESLIRQEDTIIFSLIERSKYPFNPSLYDQTLGLVSGFSGSLVHFFVKESEALQAKAGRFENPEENAFFPHDLPPSLVSSSQYPQILYPAAAPININNDIWDAYFNKLLPLIAVAGDDGNYASTAASDLNCLQALSRRIHYGKFVAEVKFKDCPQDYEPAIRAQDREALMKLLTFERVEEQVKKRVFKKATVYGQEVKLDDKNLENGKYKVDPSIVYSLYGEWVIPLTKHVEVEYLLRRL